MEKENDKGDWVGNRNSIYSTLGASSHSDIERASKDYYATHPTAIDDLFAIEKFSDNIWECACGEGHLSERMKRFGKNVYSTDIIDRGYGDNTVDFLSCSPPLDKFDGDIITNPPYKYASEFVQKAMELSRHKTAMFLKLTFLESTSRVPLFEKYPPARIWVYSYRKPVARNGEEVWFEKSSAVCFAWFVWEVGYNASPVIGWIKPKQEDTDL